jgi:hypothetical protein
MLMIGRIDSHCHDWALHRGDYGWLRTITTRAVCYNGLFGYRTARLRALISDASACMTFRL